MTIQSKRGNTIKRHASPSNPAVHISRPGNDAVKSASELEIEQKHDGAGEGAVAEEKAVHEAAGGEKVSKTGEKRERDADAAEEHGEGAVEEKDEASVKKQKTAATTTDAVAKKKKGRPAKKVAIKDIKDASGKGGDGDDGPKKKGPGRPKKGEVKTGAGGGGGAEKKVREKKARPVANGEGIGSRTRSKKSS